MAAFTWEDPLRLDEQLSTDERQIRDSARVHDHRLPVAGREGPLLPERMSGQLPVSGIAQALTGFG